MLPSDDGPTASGTQAPLQVCAVTVVEKAAQRRTCKLPRVLSFEEGDGLSLVSLLAVERIGVVTASTNRVIELLQVVPVCDVHAGISQGMLVNERVFGSQHVHILRREPLHRRP